MPSHPFMILKIKVSLILLLALLVSCGEKETTEDAGASTKNGNEVLAPKEKQLTQLQICMERVMPSAKSFESLGNAEQDSVRQCMQSEIMKARNLELPRQRVSADESQGELTPEEQWASDNEQRICKAGVAFKNRWGDPGQAPVGSYVGYRSGEHVFREQNGVAKIRCLIAGRRIFMGWHTRPFDIYKSGDIYYLFEQHESGVRIVERAHGLEEQRDYVFE